MNNRRSINACCVWMAQRPCGMRTARAAATWGRQAPSLAEHLLSAYCVPRAADRRDGRRDPRPRPGPPGPPRTSAGATCRQPPRRPDPDAADQLRPPGLQAAAHAPPTSIGHSQRQSTVPGFYWPFLLPIVRQRLPAPESSPPPGYGCIYQMLPTGNRNVDI